MGYQVPMIEVAVVVALDGVEPEEHFLYLAPYAERRDGPESVADYLNGRRRFFPMVIAGVPKMINRDQILWLREQGVHSNGDPAIAPSSRSLMRCAVSWISAARCRRTSSVG